LSDYIEIMVFFWVDFDIRMSIGIKLLLCLICKYVYEHVHGLYMYEYIYIYECASMSVFMDMYEYTLESKPLNGRKLAIELMEAK